MPHPITLTEFKNTVKALMLELRVEFPNLDYAGIIPVNDPTFRYGPTPTNTEVFATTGGDGVHYSILELSEYIQPVIMTVPMNFGNSMKSYNWVIAENLNEFLSIGYYVGWFPIEEFCYDKERAIGLYSAKITDEESKNIPDIQFIKKLRERFGYEHIPLKNERLKELETKYFDHLQFDPEFIARFIKNSD
jgi:hypothetical protein